MDALTLLHQDAVTAAPQLLGWELTCQTADGLAGGRIVEVEAYHGELDPASHAYRGRSMRNQPMFEAAGTMYVYRSYGIHLCLNLVTGPAGSAQAILIRALEPTLGQDLMQFRRHQTNERLLASGPGRVGQALGLNLAMSGSRLGGAISLKPPRTAVAPTDLVASPRIGISSAQDVLWRFYVRHNQFVSRS